MARIGPAEDGDMDPRARRALGELHAAWGRPWNVSRGLANNPAVLEAFIALQAGLDKSGLTPEDREVICMEMARANGCHYCVPAHRQAARNLGVDSDLIERIARGETLEGAARPAVIQRLVRRLVAAKGKLTDQEFQSFQDQGVTPPQMIAVVAEIAHCTLTNYFNRLADTDLDPFLERFWD
jgi:uncharacterized peroxidase-related enzyme